MCIFLHNSILQILDKINKRLNLPQCPCMCLHTVRLELSLLHETILRVDIVATKVVWESVKANFFVFSRCHFNLRAFII